MTALISTRQNAPATHRCINPTGEVICFESFGVRITLVLDFKEERLLRADPETETKTAVSSGRESLDHQVVLRRALKADPETKTAGSSGRESLDHQAVLRRALKADPETKTAGSSGRESLDHQMILRRALKAETRDCLPPGWRPIAAATDHEVVFCVVPATRGWSRPYRLQVDGQAVFDTDSKDLALFQLESVIQMLVAEHATRQTFVHAGVVAWRGKAILLPGRSFAGKSTLVAALLQAGASYGSDEYAPLDPHGRVHPYPRRISLRSPDGIKTKRVAAEAYGCAVEQGPLDVGMIVVTNYIAKAAWAGEAISAGDMALEMLDNAVPARSRPKGALQAISQAIHGAICVRGPRGDAQETAKALLASL